MVGRADRVEKKEQIKTRLTGSQSMYLHLNERQISSTLQIDLSGRFHLFSTLLYNEPFMPCTGKNIRESVSLINLQHGKTTDIRQEYLWIKLM